MEKKLTPKAGSLILVENGKPTEISFTNIKAANQYLLEQNQTVGFEWTVGWLFKLKTNQSSFEIVKADGSKIKTSPTYQLINY